MTTSPLPTPDDRTLGCSAAQRISCLVRCVWTWPSRCTWLLRIRPDTRFSTCTPTEKARTP